MHRCPQSTEDKRSSRRLIINPHTRHKATASPHPPHAAARRRRRHLRTPPHAAVVAVTAARRRRCHCRILLLRRSHPFASGSCLARRRRCRYRRLPPSLPLPHPPPPSFAACHRCRRGLRRGEGGETATSSHAAGQEEGRGVRPVIQGRIPRVVVCRASAAMKTVADEDRPSTSLRPPRG